MTLLAQEFVGMVTSDVSVETRDQSAPTFLLNMTLIVRIIGRKHSILRTILEPRLEPKWLRIYIYTYIHIYI